MLTTRGYKNSSNLLGRVLAPVLKIKSNRGEYHFFCLSIFKLSTRLVLKFLSESSFEFSSFLPTLVVGSYPQNFSVGYLWIKILCKVNYESHQIGTAIIAALTIIRFYLAASSNDSPPFQNQFSFGL